MLYVVFESHCFSLGVITREKAEKQAFRYSSLVFTSCFSWKKRVPVMDRNETHRTANAYSLM